ncbi:acid protease [Punctularia strigosozonata HHB-11173 SS5]|uniref:acid protease n=1 Tax=Punctularia strigosozonata (strain HHB-11173) TaxID=741275 RepID=UPI00044184BD|nr:acid protease [Punctularia strigosozonata HHB-11173 SS5]EIN07738.1 acid protease [Punctularia strigosozonata HHB-11173 SS5]
MRHIPAPPYGMPGLIHALWVPYDARVRLLATLRFLLPFLRAAVICTWAVSVPFRNVAAERTSSSATRRTSRFSLKRASRTPPGHDFSSRDPGTPLHDKHGFAYLAEILVGNQPFNVILDTGSADLWVVSDACSNADCLAVPRYHRTSTLHLSGAPFALNYLSGNVSGLIGTETVTAANYQVASQTFALANNTQGMNLAGMGHSGILGLAFPIEAAISATAGRPLLSNLFDSFEEDRRFFSVRLSNDDLESSFTMGELDPRASTAKTLDDFFYVPVRPLASGAYDYWKVSVESIAVDGASVRLGSSKVPGSSKQIAVLDSGTTYVLGPSADVKNFWHTVGGARQISGSWQTFFIDPADVSQMNVQRDGDWCMGGVQANDKARQLWRLAPGGRLSSCKFPFRYPLCALYTGSLTQPFFPQSVYAVHHGPTSSQPLRVGLINTTDPSAALVAFRSARGPDPLPSVSTAHIASARRVDLSGAAGVYFIALAAGLISGVLVTLTSLRLSRSRLFKKHVKKQRM